MWECMHRNICGKPSWEVHQPVPTWPHLHSYGMPIMMGRPPSQIIWKLGVGQSPTSNNTREIPPFAVLVSTKTIIHDDKKLNNSVPIILFWILLDDDVPSQVGGRLLDCGGLIRPDHVLKGVQKVCKKEAISSRWRMAWPRKRWLLTLEQTQNYSGSHLHFPLQNVSSPPHSVNGPHTYHPCIWWF